MHCRQCNAAVNDIIVQRLHSSRLLCSVISSFLKRVSFGMRSLIVPRKLVRSKLIGLCFLFRQTSFTLVICLNYFPFEVKMRTYNGIMPPPPDLRCAAYFLAEARVCVIPQASCQSGFRKEILMEGPQWQIDFPQVVFPRSLLDIAFFRIDWFLNPFRKELAHLRWRTKPIIIFQPRSRMVLPKKGLVQGVFHPSAVTLKNKYDPLE